RLEEQEVDATVDEATGLLEVGVHELGEGDVALAGIVDVRRDGRRPDGRTEGTHDPARLPRVRGGDVVGGGPGQACRREVDLVGEVLHAVVGQGDALGVEGVGLDEVGARLEVLPVQLRDEVRLGEDEAGVVALDVNRPVGDTLPGEVRLGESLPLDHRPHAAVHDEDLPAQYLLEVLGGVGTKCGVGHRRILSSGSGVTCHYPHRVPSPRVGAMAASPEQTPRGIRLATISSVPVYLGWSWLLLGGIIIVLLGPGTAARFGPVTGYGIAAAYALALLLSVLAHEAAHAVAATAFGHRVHRVVADLWGGQDRKS